MIRLLLITRNALSTDTSTGNTMSNFFSNWDGDMANIYCRDEKIKNNICKKYYKITEQQLINNIVRHTSVGKQFEYNDFSELADDNSEIELQKKETKKYSFFRNHRYMIFLWLRELIWTIGKWKNEKISLFLDSYNPDIIFCPLYDCYFIYNILFYVHKRTKARVVLYTGDDVYSMKHFSLSPLYWINKTILRRKIRKAVGISDYRICLTEMQQKEYSEIFNVEFTLCMKSALDITDKLKISFSSPIKMVYTGNLNLGRHKTIGLIGKALDSINSDQERIQLHVYSGSTLTRRMEKDLKYRSIIFHGNVNSEKIGSIQEDADILVHVEDFSLKNRSVTRLSLSTKIIDYLSHGKCIFAVGPDNIASMNYLKENDAALCVFDKKNIEKQLKQLLDNSKLIIEYEKKALSCAKGKHDCNINQNKLYKDLRELVNESSTN